MSKKEKKVLDVEVKESDTEKSKAESKHQEGKKAKSEQENPKEEKAPKVKDFESFTEFLDFYLAKKAPQLAVGVKEFLVKIFPWFSLLGIILGVVFIIPAILIALGLGAVVASLELLNSRGVEINASIGLFVSILFAIAQLTLSALALGGLFARQKKGWTYSYYGLYLSLAGTVMSSLLINGRFDIASPIISFAIGAYFLFQIRKHYK